MSENICGGLSLILLNIGGRVNKIVYTRKILANENVKDNKTKYYIEIVIDPVFAEKYGIDLKVVNLKYFISEQYQNIKPNKKTGLDDGWACIAGPINDCLNTLTDDDKYKFITMVIAMTDKVRNDFAMILSDPVFKIRNTVNLAKELGLTLAELVKEISLLEKIRAYIDKHLYIGNFDNVGNNPQDKKPITYYEEDAKRLITLAILIKMLFPIFGLWITFFKTPKKKGEQGNVEDDEMKSKKTIYCSMILDNLLDRYFEEDMVKLDLYIEHFAKAIYDDYKQLPSTGNDVSDPNKDITYFTAGAFMGISTDSLIEHSKSSLLIKALVNGNMASSVGTERTILSYIHRTVNGTIATELNKRSDKKNMIHRRTDPTKKSDDVTPQFEIDSVPSDTSLKVLGIIDCQIDKIVSDALLSFDDPDIWEHYEKCLAFYLYNKIIPTRLSRLCLATYFGAELGGAESILYINSRRYTELLTVLQLYCIKSNMIELAHMLTANPSGVKLIQNDYKAYVSVITAECRWKYRFCADTMDISIKNIVDDINKKVYTLNTADRVWTMLEETNINGDIIEPTLDYLKELVTILVIS